MSSGAFSFAPSVLQLACTPPHSSNNDSGVVIPPEAVYAPETNPTRPVRAYIGPHLDFVGRGGQNSNIYDPYSTPEFFQHSQDYNARKGLCERTAPQYTAGPTPENLKPWLHDANGVDFLSLDKRTLSTSIMRVEELAALESAQNGFDVTLYAKKRKQSKTIASEHTRNVLKKARPPKKKVDALKKKWRRLTFSKIIPGKERQRLYRGEVLLMKGYHGGRLIRRKIHRKLKAKPQKALIGKKPNPLKLLVGLITRKKITATGASLVASFSKFWKIIVRRFKGDALTKWQKKLAKNYEKNVEKEYPRDAGKKNVFKKTKGKGKDKNKKVTLKIPLENTYGWKAAGVGLAD